MPKVIHLIPKCEANVESPEPTVFIKTERDNLPDFFYECVEAFKEAGYILTNSTAPLGGSANNNDPDTLYPRYG